MRICITTDERKRTLRFDQQFKGNRFKLPSKKCQQGNTLLVNQKVTTDPNTVLTAWERHFRNLSAKNEELSPAMSCMEEQVEQLMTASFLGMKTACWMFLFVLRRLMSSWEN